jgi:hypothetical protein
MTEPGSGYQSSPFIEKPDVEKQLEFEKVGDITSIRLGDEYDYVLKAALVAVLTSLGAAGWGEFLGRRWLPGT